MLFLYIKTSLSEVQNTSVSDIPPKYRPYQYRFPCDEDPQLYKDTSHAARQYYFIYQILANGNTCFRVGQYTKTPYQNN